MTARSKFFPLDKIAARMNMGQPIKKVSKLKMFSKIWTLSHRKEFAEKPIKKAEGEFKNFPRFAYAHFIGSIFENSVNTVIEGRSIYSRGPPNKLKRVKQTIEHCCHILNFKNKGGINDGMKSANYFMPSRNLAFHLKIYRTHAIISTGLKISIVSKIG